MTLNRPEGLASTISSGQLPLGRRVVRHLIAAALATGSELILIGLSPGIALVPAFAVAIAVAIFHGTGDGLARVALIAAWALALPVIWLAGAIGIALGIREILKVPLLVPLFAALFPPVLIIALIAAGEAQTAVELIGALREITELRRLAE